MIVKEVKPGEIEITCPTSNLPLTRVSEYGMFCAAKECSCERGSIEAAKHLKKLLTLFR